MLKLIIGVKGTGKTKTLISMVNEAVEKSHGDVVCIEKGVSHYEVGKKCYFDKSNISRWFSKGYYPTLDILEQLCLYFNVSNDYLLGRTDYRK